MPRDDQPMTPQRRVSVRRARQGGGFSGGGARGSGRVDGMPRYQERDEVDDAIDPEQMNANVRTMPVPHAAPRDPDGGDDPRNRMMQVDMAGSSAYSKEYRLSLLHRLLMRRIPLDQIARQLGVSISTIEKDRVELKKRLREAARELDINEMVGNQTELYDEISGMALRIAGQSSGPTAAPTPMRLAAMRTALAANADKSRFYQSAGVFDVLRFRRAEDGNNISDVQHLMSRTEEMLQRLVEGDDSGGDKDDRRPASPVRRRRAPRGFKDFQDTDQNDHAEVLDI